MKQHKSLINRLSVSQFHLDKKIQPSFNLTNRTFQSGACTIKHCEFLLTVNGIFSSELVSAVMLVTNTLAYF